MRERMAKEARDRVSYLLFLKGCPLKYFCPVNRGAEPGVSVMSQEGSGFVYRVFLPRLSRGGFATITGNITSRVRPEMDLRLVEERG